MFFIFSKIFSPSRGGYVFSRKKWFHVYKAACGERWSMGSFGFVILLTHRYWHFYWRAGVSLSILPWGERLKTRGGRKVAATLAFDVQWPLV